MYVPSTMYRGEIRDGGVLMVLEQARSTAKATPGKSSTAPASSLRTGARSHRSDRYCSTISRLSNKGSVAVRSGLEILLKYPSKHTVALWDLKALLSRQLNGWSEKHDSRAVYGRLSVK